MTKTLEEDEYGGNIYNAWLCPLPPLLHESKALVDVYFQATYDVIIHNNCVLVGHEAINCYFFLLIMLFGNFTYVYMPGHFFRIMPVLLY